MANPLELFDVVDDNNIVIGFAPRSECHGNPQLIHRAVHVLVFNPRGDLLLQKRPLDKDIQPGKWDTSVGGHLDQGEAFLAAAKREMQEELGVSGVPLTFLYASKIRNEIESENIETFLAVTSQAIAPAPDEADEVRYWQPSEIESSLGSGVFTPNFEEEWLMFKEFSRKYQTTEMDKTGLRAGDSFPDLLMRLSEA
jgi:isopentenyl-diphosphate delta-isomerase type 1